MSHLYAQKKRREQRILQALQLSPFDNNSVRIYGYILQHSQQYKEAELWYLYASRLRPNEFSNVEFLAGLYYVTSRYDKARPCFKQLVKKNFSADYAHRKLGS